MIDGRFLSGGDYYSVWRSISGTGLSFAVLSVAPGVHRLYSLYGQPFGGIFYGFRTNEAYGLPLGVFVRDQSVEYLELMFRSEILSTVASLETTTEISTNSETSTTSDYTSLMTEMVTNITSTIDLSPLDLSYLLDVSATGVTVNLTYSVSDSSVLVTQADNTTTSYLTHLDISTIQDTFFNDTVNVTMFSSTNPIFTRKKMSLEINSSVEMVENSSFTTNSTILSNSTNNRGVITITVGNVFTTDTFTPAPAINAGGNASSKYELNDTSYYATRSPGYRDSNDTRYYATRSPGYRDSNGTSNGMDDRFMQNTSEATRTYDNISSDYTTDMPENNVTTIYQAARDYSDLSWSSSINPFPAIPFRNNTIEITSSSEEPDDLFISETSPGLFETPETFTDNITAQQPTTVQLEPAITSNTNWFSFNSTATNATEVSTNSTKIANNYANTPLAVASTEQGSVSVVVILVASIFGGIPLLCVLICALYACLRYNKRVCCRKAAVIRRMSTRVSHADTPEIIRDGSSEKTASSAVTLPARNKECHHYEGGYNESTLSPKNEQLHNVSRLSRPSMNHPLTPAYRPRPELPTILTSDENSFYSTNIDDRSDVSIQIYTDRSMVSSSYSPGGVHLPTNRANTLNVGTSTQEMLVDRSPHLSQVKKSMEVSEYKQSVEKLLVTSAWAMRMSTKILVPFVDKKHVQDVSVMDSLKEFPRDELLGSLCIESLCIESSLEISVEGAEDTKQ